MLKTESFIENRIIWNAGRHKLPAGNCFICSSEHPYENLTAQHEHLGKPILLFALDEKNWSVLGTKGISGILDDDFRSIDYSEIVEFDGFEAAREKKTEKSKLSELKVKTQQHEILFKTAPGEEFFAFWNISLMLQRILSK
jgi:hypothetical protein